MNEPDFDEIDEDEAHQEDYDAWGSEVACEVCPYCNGTQVASDGDICAVCDGEGVR